LGGGDSYLVDLQSQVDAARLGLAQNRQRYSEDHPDVARSLRSLTNLEQELERAMAENRPYQASSLPEDPYTQQLKLRMDAEETNIRSVAIARLRRDSDTDCIPE